MEKKEGQISISFSETFFDNTNLDQSLFAYVRANIQEENLKKVGKNKWYAEIERPDEKSGVAFVKDASFFVGQANNGVKEIRVLSEDHIPAYGIRAEILKTGNKLNKLKEFKIENAYLITEKDEPLPPMTLLSQYLDGDLAILKKDLPLYLINSVDFWANKEYAYGQ